jgi:hypothetical protein
MNTSRIGAKAFGAALAAVVLCGQVALAQEGGRGGGGFEGGRGGGAGGGRGGRGGRDLGADPFAEEAGRPRSNPNLRLTTYEVGDLVVTVPDYSAPDVTAMGGGDGAAFYGGGRGGGFGGGGMVMTPSGQAFDRGGAPLNSQPAPITIYNLQQVLTKVVDPMSWAVNGGDGQVEIIGTSLVVLNTSEAHELVGILLSELRQGSAARRSVTVDARWVLLNSDELERLDPNRDEAREETQSLDAAVLAEYTRRPSSLRGLTNCFSGQSVYLISGTRRNVVKSYIPVVGSVEFPGESATIVELTKQPGEWVEPGETIAVVNDRQARNRLLHFVQEGGGEFSGFDGGRGEMSMMGGSVGYQPVVETPNFGVLLQVRPTLIHGEDAAVVDLTSTITFPSIDRGLGSDAGGNLRLEGGEGRGTLRIQAMPAVDRVAIDTQELATTLRVPLGQPVLVGGMSHVAPEAATEGGEAAAEGEETRQLYLILEVR